MPALTIIEIKALDFGYLTGSDILKYCPFQFIQKQLLVDDSYLEDAVFTSYTEIKSQLETKCDIDIELTKRTADRNLLIVKVMAIEATRNLTSNIPGIPDNILKNFEWYDKTMINIRNGNISLPYAIKASDNKISKTEIIENDFYQIG
jgi:hypothetical protein